MRIVGAVDGDPQHPGTASGTAKHLLDALARRHEVERVDYSLTGWQRTMLLAGTARLPKEAWRARYHQNGLAWRLRSRNLRHALESIPHDLALLVLGLVTPAAFPGPYALFADTTFHTVARYWPPWETKSRLGKIYERELFRSARHIFANNAQMVTELVDHYGVPADRTSVVNGGLNFSPVPPRLRSREPVVLFVGRDFERKGGDVLLDAFRLVREEIPDARLLMVGGSFSVDQPGVVIIGEITDRQELAELYRQAALFCLPSRYDPFPNSFAEAMAHGLPCVGTTVGGIPEIIQHEHQGLLVPPNDSSALGTALVQLLSDPGYADSLGRAARTRVTTELTWDRVVDRMQPDLAT